MEWDLELTAAGRSMCPWVLPIDFKPLTSSPHRPVFLPITGLPSAKRLLTLSVRPLATIKLFGSSGAVIVFTHIINILDLQYFHRKLWAKTHLRLQCGQPD